MSLNFASRTYLQLLFTLLFSYCYQGAVQSSEVIALQRDIRPNEWPSPGQTISATSAVSIEVKNPLHGSTIYCEPGQLRANIDLGINTYIDSSHGEPPSLRFAVLIDDSSMPVVADISTFYTNGAFLHNVLPGKRKIGISLISGDPETILIRTLIEIQVLNDLNVSDIHRWKSSVVDSAQSHHQSESSTAFAVQQAGATAPVAEDAFNRQLYFQSVYDLAYWSGGDTSVKSLSGSGSQPKEAAWAKRAVMELVSSEVWAQQWRGQRVSRLVDAPCGDVGWMDLPLLVSMNVSYLGMDIVPSVIENNRRKYESISIPTAADTGVGATTGTAGAGATIAEAGVSFQQLDVLEDELPAMTSSDLLIVRSLMIHQPIAENLKLLRKIAASGVKRVLLTTFMLADVNRADFVLAVGHFINLKRAPYCVCDPLALYAEKEPDMYLGLWDLEEFPHCFAGRNVSATSC